MNILYFQRIVPHYRIDIFQELSNKLNIIVCHSKEKSNSTLKGCVHQLSFPNIEIKRLYFGKKETFMLQDILSPILKVRPKIIISEFALSYFTLWLLYLLRPLFNYKLILHTHGIKNGAMGNPYKNLWSRIAFVLYNKADAVIFYDKQRKNIVENKIKSKEKLFVATNTINSDKLIGYCRELKKTNPAIIKREIGFKHKFNIVFIGRLLKEKNIKMLLEVFSVLSRSIDVGLHIIGDGPERDLVLEYKKENASINYHGEIYDNEIIGKYLFAADINMNLGYVGLSVVHSFCFGTPILTCKDVSHSPEIIYIKNGINGIICELDKESIISKTQELFNNEKMLKTYSENAFNTAVEDCHISKMIDGFAQAINFLRNK